MNEHLIQLVIIFFVIHNMFFFLVLVRTFLAASDVNHFPDLNISLNKNVQFSVPVYSYSSDSLIKSHSRYHCLAYCI